MGTNVKRERQQVHALVDQLPEEKLDAVVHLLQVMTDPVARAVAHAPLDEEPLTLEEIRALDESREWLKHNEGISHDQVLAELGITQEDIDRYNKAR